MTAPCENIRPGCFLTTKSSPSGEMSYYLFLPEGAGDSFKIGEHEIMTLSCQSPLAAALMGKRRGEMANSRGSRIKIIDVQ